RFRLDARILCKARAGLLRFGKPEFRRGYRLDAVAAKQVAHFTEFAGVVGRDYELAGDAPLLRAHVTAIFCRSTNLPMPLRASAISARNCCSLNGIFSAVPWTSTRLP